MHLAIHSVWKRREKCVIRARCGLNGDDDTIVSSPAVVEVGVLEVERSLGEAVLVSDVVHLVDDVEGVDSGCVEIIARSRDDTRVLDIDKSQVVLRLYRYVRLYAFV